MNTADPYSWLADPGSDEVRSWLEAQDERTRAFFDSNGLLETLTPRMKARLSAIVPVVVPRGYGKRFYGVRRGRVLEFVDGKEGEIVRVEGATNIVGGNASGSVIVVGMRGSDDKVSLVAIDTDSGEPTGPVTPVGVANLSRGGVVAVAGSMLYWVSREDWRSPVRVVRRPLGSDSADNIVVHEADVDTDVEIYTSSDETWIALLVHRGERDSAIFISAAGEDTAWRRILPEAVGHAELLWFEGMLLVNTDWLAPNHRIMAIDPVAGTVQELVAERDCPILHFSVAGGRLFVGYLDDVCTRVDIFDRRGEALGSVEAPGRVTQSPMYGSPVVDRAAFTASDDCHPPTRFWYDVPGNLVEGTFPGDDDIVTTQVRYASRDDTMVPMRIMRRTDVAFDGNCPTILFGYGGWGQSQFPWYDPFVAEWVSLGGVYAVANIRGGGEYGKAWHEQGRLLYKHNVFDDFEHAMRWLCDNGITSPERLAVRGFSNGGLLTAVMVTRCPSLFAAALSHFGPYDLTNFDVNPSVKEELGDPADPVHLENLLSYSPYHNVIKGVRYPAMFIRAGGSELRLTAHDSFRMTARLQDASSSNLPVLLRYFPDLGHGINRMSASVDQQARYDAEELAFVCHVLGVDVAGSG